jgi:tetratricopeptide (TPR) repeat protein
MGSLSNYYTEQYSNGNRNVIAPLRREEPNLLHARSVARQHGWWMALMKTMQGLSQLYDHTGRRTEWKRLVEEIVPDFVGADDLPLPGREEQWGLVNEYCVRLAREARDLATAERLQRLRVDWERRRAASLLSRPVQSLSAGEKNTLRTLAVSLEQLAIMLREQGKAECVEPSKEAISINQFIGDKSTEAISAFNLGHAYKDLPALRNLDEAERWYRRSLELWAEGDEQGKGGCIKQIGMVFHERYKEAQRVNAPKSELLQNLNTAIDYLQNAIRLIPPTAVDDLAATHGALASIFHDAGDTDRSISEFHKSAQLDEQQGNVYRAGATRLNIAVILANNGRLSDALLYAKSALRDFESYQGRAKEMEDETKRVIEWIEEAS